MRKNSAAVVTLEPVVVLTALNRGNMALPRFPLFYFVCVYTA
jgi:hypothetical protein